MPPADISNSSLLTRMSIEGWIALFMVIVGGISSHVTLAGDQEHTANKVLANEAKLIDVQETVSKIQTDIAIVKNEQRHMNQTVLKLQTAQTDELKQIRKMLERQQ